MKGETTAPPSSGLSAVAQLVRRHDRDRYMTALFAPAARREALLALYAFNYEIARVREAVTQSTLGQIRLQWWREVVDAAFAGAPTRQHPIALAVTAAIREHRLDRVPLDRLIDARERDLDGEPPARMAVLEDYAEGSSATVMRLALRVLGVSGGETTAAEAGIGYALAGLLRAMPFHARAGRCYIPAEIAARAGLDLGDYAALRSTPALRRAVAEIADKAALHLRAARADRREVPRAGLPALLPAVIAERALARLRRAGNDPFDPRLAQPDPLQSWRLLLAMLRGRF